MWLCTQYHIPTRTEAKLHVIWLLLNNSFFVWVNVPSTLNAFVRKNFRREDVETRTRFFPLFFISFFLSFFPGPVFLALYSGKNLSAHSALRCIPTELRRDAQEQCHKVYIPLHQILWGGWSQAAAERYSAREPSCPHTPSHPLRRCRLPSRPSAPTSRPHARTLARGPPEPLSISD